MLCIIIPGILLGVTSSILSQGISFVKFENSLLHVQTNSTTKQVRLKEDVESCIFSGKFEEEEGSKILLTGCNDAIELQIESKTFGDLIFSSAGLDVNVNENIIDNYNNTTPSKRVVRSSLKEVDDDFENYEPPGQIAFHVNVYLDLFWTNRLQGESLKQAKQVIVHAKHLLKHKSLKTKIELIVENILADRGDHLDVGFNNLKENIKAKIKKPWTVLGSPVASVYLTDSVTTKINENSPRGWAMQSSICDEDQMLARCIVKYVKTPLNTAIVVAHEIMHMFGVNHDHESEDDACMQNIFIMNSNTLTHRFEWSSCTNKDFHTFYKGIISKNGKFCLGTHGNIKIVIPYQL